MFDQLTAGLPLVKGGKLKLLAVTTATRTPLSPETPTMQEAGVPDFEMVSWQAVYAPKGTPKPVVDRLNAEIVKILKSQDVSDKLAGANGMTIVASHARRAHRAHAEGNPALGRAREEVRRAAELIATPTCTSSTITRESRHGTVRGHPQAPAQGEHRHAVHAALQAWLAQRVHAGRGPHHHAFGRQPRGPAFTMRSIPAREDLDQISAFDNPDHPQRKAIESTPPGHVLVLDCRGEKRVASGGQILTTRLMVRGAAGLVSDGSIRDSGAISQMDFPVYAAGGSAPLNLLLHHALEQNIPIGCGGVAVYPGDVIVGDDEGVVVIPRHLADEVAEQGEEQEKMEAFVLERVQGGAKLAGTYPPSEETKAAFGVWRKERGI